VAVFGFVGGFGREMLPLKRFEVALPPHFHQSQLPLTSFWLWGGLLISTNHDSRLNILAMTILQKNGLSVATNHCHLGHPTKHSLSI
jgi:hypothetical protein